MDDTDNKISLTDHDLLLELRVELRLLRADIQSMREDTKATIADHEVRIRLLESAVGTMVATRAADDRFTRIGGAVLIFLVGIVEFFVNRYIK